MGISIRAKDPEQLNMWIQRIEECQRSGQYATEWCASRGLSAKTYGYWYRKIRKMKASQETRTSEKFYDISNIMGTGSVIASIHIGSSTVDIYSGADENTIASIIRVMKSC